MSRKMLVYFNEDECRTEFYDETGKMFSQIHENDGDWRGEYMNGLMAHYGVEVETVTKKPKKEKKK